jgi:hypothetical protein
MKALILLIGLLSVPLSAVLVTVDPDEFAAGTDISNAWTGITLSSGGGGANLDGKVYAAYRSGSLGNEVFANSRISSKLWLNNSTPGSYYYLQVDFHTPANHVLIDVISDNGSDFPGLCYSTDGINYKWIQDYPVLGPGQIYTTAVPLRPAADIVSVRIGGLGSISSYAVLLDNLRYEIPEPATCLLLLSGWLLLKNRKK